MINLLVILFILKLFAQKNIFNYVFINRKRALLLSFFKNYIRCTKTPFNVNADCYSNGNKMLRFAKLTNCVWFRKIKRTASSQCKTNV